MKYIVNLEGHDGLFSCKTEFKCGDEFFARGISNSGCFINPFRYLSPPGLDASGVPGRRALLVSMQPGRNRDMKHPQNRLPS